VSSAGSCAFAHVAHLFLGSHAQPLVRDGGLTVVGLTPMKVMAVSEFKAGCLAVVEEVSGSGESVLITKRGSPVAELVPASGSQERPRNLGAMAGTARLADDLVTPAAQPEDWRALEVGQPHARG
jgi:prevent-host-death family protein